MKKIFFIFIVLNFSQHLCFGTKDSITSNTKNKLIISVSGGAALPEGIFRQYERKGNVFALNNGVNIAGGASIGCYGKLDFNYLICKNFGATAMLYSSVNPGKKPSNKELMPNSRFGGLGNFSTVSLYKYEIESWYTNGALIGIYAETDHRFITLNFKLNIGVQQVKSPESHMHQAWESYEMGKGTTSTTISVETQPSMISYNVVGNLGVDSRFNFSKKLKARIGIENFFSQAEFNGNLNYVSNTNNSNGTTGHTEFQQKLHFTKNVFLFCLNVGVSYVLN